MGTGQHLTHLQGCKTINTAHGKGAQKRKGKTMEKITLSKKAALAAADSLNFYLEDEWELTPKTRAMVIAFDELLEGLGSAWDEYNQAETEKVEQATREREELNASPAGLGNWLRMIFNAGDQDETSWKHLGHAFAALVNFGDWKLAQDYERPWMGSLPHMETALNIWWSRVADIYEADPEATLQEAERLSKDQGGMFSHLTAYLDDYEGAAH